MIFKPWQIDWDLLWSRLCHFLLYSISVFHPNFSISPISQILFEITHWCCRTLIVIDGVILSVSTSHHFPSLGNRLWIPSTIEIIRSKWVCEQTDINPISFKIGCQFSEFASESFSRTYLKFFTFPWPVEGSWWFESDSKLPRTENATWIGTRLLKSFFLRQVNSWMSRAFMSADHFLSLHLN
jgi:hypothetical protein